VKYAAILLFCGVAAADSMPMPFLVTEHLDAPACEIEGRAVSCAYLIALYHRAKDDLTPRQRGI
jgi:hypothetical protein